MANRALKVIASDPELSNALTKFVIDGRLSLIRHCGFKTFNEIATALGLYDARVTQTEYAELIKKTWHLQRKLLAESKDPNR